MHAELQGTGQSQQFVGITSGCRGVGKEMGSPLFQLEIIPPAQSLSPTLLQGPSRYWKARVVVPQDLLCVQEQSGKFSFLVQFVSSLPLAELSSPSSSECASGVFLLRVPPPPATPLMYRCSLHLISSKTALPLFSGL